MKNKVMTVALITITSFNLVLTLVMMATLTPQVDRVNSLIEKICKVNNMELESNNIDISNIPIDDIASYSVNSGEKMLINLADGKHYASISVSLSINKGSERYKNTKMEILKEHESIIMDTINQVIRTYTKDDFLKNTNKAHDEICSKLQKLYGKDYIIGINFSSLTVQ